MNRGPGVNVKPEDHLSPASIRGETARKGGHKIPTSVVLRETPSRAPNVGPCLTRNELSEEKCADRRKRLYWNK